VIVVAVFIANSKLGMAMIGIREDEDASIAAGVDAMRTKIISLVISAALTGVAGAVYAFSLSYVDPSSAFSLNWVIISVFPAVIGGVGTIVGPIIGSIFFSFLDQMLSVYGSYSLIIFGVLLILVVLLLPRGIYTTLRDRFGKQFMAQPSRKTASSDLAVTTRAKSADGATLDHES
jgi:branched-chain amino acid transport system permease protein